MRPKYTLKKGQRKEMIYRSEEMTIYASGKERPITAHIADNTGLCYNKPPRWSGTVLEGWVVTHLASMRTLCAPMGTEYESKLLLEKIAGIVDWRMSGEEIIKYPEIAVKVKQIRIDITNNLNQRLKKSMQKCGMPECIIKDAMHELKDGDYPILRNTLLYAFNLIPLQTEV